MKTFGKVPSGALKIKTQQSPNYINGAFKNISETPMMVEGTSPLKLMKDFFGPSKGREPSKKIPSIKSDVNLKISDAPVVTWFGHSSYHILMEDKHLLIDPVFCGYASPFPFMVKAFEGSNIFNADDFQTVDVLLLTHDHYDHLDYLTMQALKGKVKQVCCSLGVAAHLIYWGFDKKIIYEFDWWDSLTIDDTLTLSSAPARHFSGRGLNRAQSLWSSFILKSKSHQLYLGGDSGYDTHFKMIAEKHGSFDIALLECGQYNAKWPFIHMTPEQSVQAGMDLNAKIVMPVHWGKFALAFHPWNEPVIRFVAEADKKGISYTTPLIGEKIIVGENYPDKNWWN